MVSRRLEAEKGAFAETRKALMHRPGFSTTGLTPTLCFWTGRLPGIGPFVRPAK
jgi:hypothetical protein